MRDTDNQRLDLTGIFPEIPASCDHALMSAARSVKEETRMKKHYPIRRTLIIAAALVAISAAALAVYAPRVAELFGYFDGADFQAWLEEGDVARPEASIKVDGVTFTLDEVVYRDNGLYGCGTITPPKGMEIVVLDAEASDPWGFDAHHGAKAPEGTPTIAQKAAQDGSELRHADVSLEKVGVDGGELQRPEVYGADMLPQADGSWQYLFLIDDKSVPQGDMYTIVLSASVSKMTEEGVVDASSSEYAEWTVDIEPTPAKEEILQPQQ